MVDKLLDEKNLDLKIQFSKDIFTINTDKDRLIQVIMNLLINAITSSFENGVIEIKASFVDSFLLIKIKDYGKGLTE